ncbi:MAG: sporulation protein YunB [Firmicutes bacterium]|nr:sporulation protein YunB [Bacillota bacterium]
MKISLSSRKLLTRGKLFFLLFIIVFLSMISLSALVFVRFKPNFEERAKDAARVKATEILNRSIGSVFDDINCCDLVNITNDDAGNVKSVSADTIKMNRLKTCICSRITELAEKNEDMIVYVPMGSLTKYNVLQGVGYKIPIKVAQDGIPSVDFEDEFVQSGINQVKHKIYITAKVDIVIVSAVMNVSETVSTEIPVAETVIVGDVPTYFGDKMSFVGR